AVGIVGVMGDAAIGIGDRNCASQIVIGVRRDRRGEAPCPVRIGSRDSRQLIVGVVRILRGLAKSVGDFRLISSGVVRVLRRPVLFVHFTDQAPLVVVT